MGIYKCFRCGGAIVTRGEESHCLNCGYAPIEVSAEVLEEYENAFGKKTVASLIRRRDT